MQLNLARVPRIDGDTGYCCMEDCLATIARNTGYSYEMYQLANWRFEYDDTIAGECIGDRFEMVYIDNLDDLERFHGITITHLGKRSSDELRQYVVADVAVGLPVMLAFDVYSCPWFWGYRRLHYPYHHFLVTGYDPEEEAFVCVDPFYQLTELRLPLALYEEGLTEVKRFALSQPQEASAPVLLEALAERLRRFYNPEYQHKMRRLIAAIEAELDLEAESRRYMDFARSIFHLNFVALMEIRVGFAQATRYIAGQYPSTELDELADGFWQMANAWMTVRRMLYKINAAGRMLEPVKRSIVRKMTSILEEELRLVDTHCR
ncbi:hypothetical protein PA598K_04153 [Paenibacillus sp. 598K]|uniref:BtrH N-terminal domain-containing protein n=1 Tax=Paenibacillus sp. 598K TaxID=1117987 RepID=UPI000FF9CA61|nr:BtrH N-terminal domain-containing protein [Paenibacillus sp. 598K]GBF75725.1 hypothetical protein PA598K_04153 [Paenibacillus sp. 598K]